MEICDNSVIFGDIYVFFFQYSLTLSQYSCLCGNCDARMSINKKRKNDINHSPFVLIIKSCAQKRVESFKKGWGALNIVVHFIFVYHCISLSCLCSMILLLCISIFHWCILLLCISTFHCHALALWFFCCVSLHFVVVPFLYDLVVMPSWSLHFIIVPLLYDFILMPLLYNFFPCHAFVIFVPFSTILLLCHDLALWFCFCALALQFYLRELCKCWFFFLLNRYLFVFPSKHVYLEIFLKVIITS